MVTLPFSVREGINIFLAGFVPTENLRFRDESLTFKVNFFVYGEEAKLSHIGNQYVSLMVFLLLEGC